MSEPREAPELSVSNVALDPAPSPEHGLLQARYASDLQAAFDGAVRSLAPRQRSLLRLHFLDGLPLERLAHVYGVHRTTLGRWIADACNHVFARTRERLGQAHRLSASTLDSLVRVLRTELDFRASLLLSQEA
jgi:RNA polymerase sigma-70 factor (ECF subfamily)